MRLSTKDQLSAVLLKPYTTKKTTILPIMLSHVGNVGVSHVKAHFYGIYWFKNQLSAFKSYSKSVQFCFANWKCIMFFTL